MTVFHIVSAFIYMIIHFIFSIFIYLYKFLTSFHLHIEPGCIMHHKLVQAEVENHCYCYVIQIVGPNTIYL